MELWQFPVVFIVGVIAWFINTLAGGGSLITLPVLIFLGCQQRWQMELIGWRSRFRVC